MKQKVFNLLTWGVVGIAVLSSMWLALEAPVADLHLAKGFEQEPALMPLPTRAKAAEPQASAVASGVAAGR